MSYKFNYLINRETRKMNKDELIKNLLKRYKESLSYLIDKGPFDIEYGNPLEKIYIKNYLKNVTIKKVIDLGDAIILLVGQKHGIAASIICRTLIETYFTSVLIEDLNSATAYKSFVFSGDYITLKKLEAFKKKSPKISTQTRVDLDQKIQEYKDLETEENYRKYIEILQDIVQKKYGGKLGKPLADKNWWAGYRPSDIAKLIQGDPYKLYLQLYPQICNNSHPNGSGYYEYLNSPHDTNWNEASLVIGINFTVWIAKLFFVDDESQESFNKIGEELGELLTKHSRTKNKMAEQGNV